VAFAIAGEPSIDLAVSYTHLDVYKRQEYLRQAAGAFQV